MDNLTLSHNFSADGSTLDINICGRLAIDTVADLLAIFKEQIPAAAKVRLNAAEVTEVDLTGLQLICSACRAASQSEKKFDFSGPVSAAMHAAIADVGLKRYTVCKHNADMPCIWCQGAK